MPVDKGRKCALIAVGQVTLQELSVFQSGRCPVLKQVMDLP
jgi:hypothetical protein